LTGDAAATVIQCLFRQNESKKYALQIAKSMFSCYVDEGSGLPYYVNTKTDERTWGVPAVFQGIQFDEIVADAQTCEEPTFEKYFDEETGRAYWYDHSSGDSYWEDEDEENAMVPFIEEDVLVQYEKLDPQESERKRLDEIQAVRNVEKAFRGLSWQDLKSATANIERTMGIDTAKQSFYTMGNQPIPSHYSSSFRSKLVEEYKVQWRKEFVDVLLKSIFSKKLRLYLP